MRARRGGARFLALICAWPIAATAAAGCVSVKSYVDPELPRVGYADLLERRDRRPIALSLEFRRNGTPHPDLSEQVREQARTILGTTNLFSRIDAKGAGSLIDTLDLILDNRGDLGDAIGKGVTTGLTFGGVGSRVTDAYVLKPSPGAAASRSRRSTDTRCTARSETPSRLQASSV